MVFLTVLILSIGLIVLSLVFGSILSASKEMSKQQDLKHNPVDYDGWGNFSRYINK